MGTILTILKPVCAHIPFHTVFVTRRRTRRQSSCRRRATPGEKQCSISGSSGVVYDLKTDKTPLKHACGFGSHDHTARHAVRPVIVSHRRIHLNGENTDTGGAVAEPLDMRMCMPSMWVNPLIRWLRDLLTGAAKRSSCCQHRHELRCLPSVPPLVLHRPQLRPLR